MKTVSLKQYADAVGFRPWVDGKKYGPKPTKDQLEGSITLADLKLKPMKDTPKGLQNVFIRQQLLKDIQSFYQPVLELNDSNHHVRLKIRTHDKLTTGRYQWAKGDLNHAKYWLTNEKYLDKDLSKKTVRDLFDRLRTFASDDNTYTDIDCSVLKQEDKDLMLKPREAPPEDGKLETVNIPGVPTLPVKPSPKREKNAASSPKTAKFKSAPVKPSTSKAAQFSKTSASKPKKFGSAPLPAASKPKGFVAFLKSLFGWLIPKPPRKQG